MSYYILIKDFGGKDRGFKFNGAADDEMRQRLSSRIQYKNGYVVFYAGLIGNCAAKDIEPDFEWEEVTEWVDELERQNRVDDIAAVINKFAESQAWKKMLPEPTEEEKIEEKKSEQKKKLRKVS